MTSSAPPALSCAIYNTMAGDYETSVSFTFLMSPEHPLFPSGVTAPIPWRLHLARPEQDTFDLQVSVLARRRKPLATTNAF